MLDPADSEPLPPLTEMPPPSSWSGGVGSAAVKVCSVRHVQSQLRQELEVFRIALLQELGTAVLPHLAPPPKIDMGTVNEALMQDVQASLREHREQYQHLVQRHEDAVERVLSNLDGAASRNEADAGCPPDAKCVDEPTVEEKCVADVPHLSTDKLDQEKIQQDLLLVGRHASSDEEMIMLGLQAATLNSSIEDAERQRELDDKPLKVHGAFGAMTTHKKKKQLKEEDYSVTKFYKTSGLAQRIARSHNFENLTLGVITVNAIYLGIDADNNHEESFMHYAWYFMMFEILFCLFFSFELLVRFLAFQDKMDCLQDRWFKFDACLVALMLFETGLVPVVILLTGIDMAVFPTFPLRLLRLLRLTRLSRLMRSLPELMTMMKGMAHASRAVLSSLLMVIILIYLWGMVLFIMLKDESELSDKFGSLPLTMWTLFIDGTILDGTGDVLWAMLHVGSAVSYSAFVCFLFFMLISALTVLNMLVGVLCEVVSNVAQSEKDDAAIRLVKKAFLNELKHFDDDGSGTISREELRKVMLNPKALEALYKLEVDIGCMKELQQMLFPKADSQARIESVMEMLLSYRGSLPSTVRHVVDGQAYTRWYLSNHVAKIADDVSAMRKEMQHSSVECL